MPLPPDDRRPPSTPDGSSNENQAAFTGDLPAEVVQPMLRYMSSNNLGAMELRIEAVAPDGPLDLEGATTQTQTATLEPDLTCFETPQEDSLDGGVFITVRPPL